MGKQDIVQVLTPDHSIEAIFLDEDATVGDLLATLSEDNEVYGSGDWAIVEVPMPRKSKQIVVLAWRFATRYLTLTPFLRVSGCAAPLTYHELFALDQGKPAYRHMNRRIAGLPYHSYPYIVRFYT